MSTRIIARTAWQRVSLRPPSNKLLERTRVNVAKIHTSVAVRATRGARARVMPPRSIPAFAGVVPCLSEGAQRPIL